MKYSRRHFLKAAAGSGLVALTTGSDGVVAAFAASPQPVPFAIPTPMTKETATFNINGKLSGGLRSSNNVMGSDRGQTGPDRNQQKLQPRQLWRLQCVAGRNAFLFLSHIGHGSRRQKDFHSRGIGR